MPKLAILTSGGDSPGMNMAIWSAVKTSDWQVLGIREGFAGLLRGDFINLEPSETMRYTRYGGTFLGSYRDPIMLVPNKSWMIAGGARPLPFNPAERLNRRNRYCRHCIM